MHKKKVEDNEPKPGVARTEKEASAIVLELAKAVAAIGGSAREYHSEPPRGPGRKPKMDNLCCTCSHSKFIRRRSKNDYIIICAYFEQIFDVPSMRVPEDIVECEGHSPEGTHTMSLNEMAQIATIIDTRDITSGHYL